MCANLVINNAITEVELDTLTGDSTVLRTDLMMDIGRSINPAPDYGQIEGAFVQGQACSVHNGRILVEKDWRVVYQGPWNIQDPR